MPTYSAGSAAVEIHPNFDNFITKLRSYLRSLDVQVDVPVNVQAAKAERELSELTRDREARVDAEADTADAKRKLDEVAKARVANIEARTKAAEQAQARLDEVAQARIAQMQAKVDGDAQAKARLDEVAQARIAHIHTQIDNANARRQLTELQRSTANVDRSGRGATNSLSGLSAIRFTALAAGIAALVPLLGGAAAAAGGLMALLAGAGAVAAIGGAGVGDAFSAAKEATEGAGVAASDYQDKLGSLADAQRRVADTQRGEHDALRRLTDARKDAKDGLDDLNLATRRGSLSERGAELAYRRAVVRLREARQKGGSGLDIEEAQLSVDSASQDITDVRVRNARTGRDAATANAAGVEGSPQVLAAHQGVVQARQDTAKAVRDLAAAQRDAAKSAAEASGITDKYAEAMAKLAPNARDFVTQIRGLGPLWTDLRKSVQDNLFAGLGTSLSDLFRTQAPALKDGLGQIATGLNGALKATFSTLNETFTQMTADGTMQRFINAVNQSLTAMAPLVNGLVSAWIHLTESMGSGVGELFTTIGTALSSPVIGELGKAFIDALNELLPSLLLFIKAVAAGLIPLLPVLSKLLSSVADALTPIMPQVSDLAEAVGDQLAVVIDKIAPSLPAIADAFVNLFDSLEPLIEPIAELGGIILQALAESLSEIFIALGPVIEELAVGLKPLIPIIAKAIRDVQPLFAELAGTLGKALLTALREITPELPGLVQSFADFLVTLAPLIPDLVRLGAEALPPLIKLFTTLLDIVRLLVEPLVTVGDVIGRLAGSKVGKFLGLPGESPGKAAPAGKPKPSVKPRQGTLNSGGKGEGDLQGHRTDPLEEFWVGGNTTGGRLPTTGPGTHTTDGILGVLGTGAPLTWLDGGEWVVNRVQSRRYDRELALINQGMFPKLPGLAAGGVAGRRAESYAKGHDGEPYVYGALDCSGILSGVTSELTGGKTGRFVTDSDFAALGWKPGLDPQGFSIGTNGGSGENGHMAGTLLGTDIESSSDAGIRFGHGAQGAADFPSIWHLPRELWSPPETAKTADPRSDPGNYVPETGTYVGPGGSSVDTTGDRSNSENLSLEGFGANAGRTVATGLANSVGLGKSVLSESNPWNKAFNEIVKANPRIGAPPEGSTPPFAPLFGTGNPPKGGVETPIPAPGAPPRPPEMSRPALGNTGHSSTVNFRDTRVANVEDLVDLAERRAAMASIGAMAAV